MKTKDEKREVPSFNDLVFENRNKEYGAYEIRRKYNMTLVLSIFVGAFCISASVIGPFLIKPTKAIVVEKPTGPKVIEIDSTLLHMQFKDPEPPKAPETVKVPVYIAPKVVDSLTENDVNTLAPNDDLGKIVKDNPVDSSVNMAPVDPNPPVEEIDKVVEIYNVSEKPMFGAGGDNEFRNWIAQNIVYPQDAIDVGLQGKVYLRFVIEKDGSLSNIEIIRSVDPVLDKEAVRVLKLSPKWTPGKQQGNPVRVNYTFPIAFTLK